MAALSVPPPGEGGSELQHEGDWQLQGAIGPADNGKNTGPVLMNRRNEMAGLKNGENQIPEMGD